MAKIEYEEAKPKFLKPYLLFHPPLPKPMHGLNPRSIMGKEWWDEKRLEAQKKNNYYCWSCGIHKTEAHYHQWLEGHEAYKIDFDSCTFELEEIVSLCHCCHNYIHSGLLEVKLRKGEIEKEKYNFIIERGNALVKSVPYMPFNDDLVEKIKEVNSSSDWSKWTLLIDGIHHKTKFKNQQQWENYYRR